MDFSLEIWYNTYRKGGFKMKTEYLLVDFDKIVKYDFQVMKK